MPTNWFEASVYLEHAFYHLLSSEYPKYSGQPARELINDARTRINEAYTEENNNK